MIERGALQKNYAVVVGIDLNGLGVLRALGGVNVPLFALDVDLRKATLATRLARKRA